jgi:hypothetical protein
MIELRQATIDDAAAIRALTRAAYAKWVKRTGREAKPMTATTVTPCGTIASTCWKSMGAWRR